MSRLRASVLAILVAATVPAAHAQSVAQEQARVAELTARLRTLDASLDSIRRLQDTVEVESIALVVTAGARPQAEEVLHRALAELDRTLGTEDRHLLDGWVVRGMHGPFSGPDQLRRAVNNLVRAAGAQRLSELGGSKLSAWGTAMERTPQSA